MTLSVLNVILAIASSARKVGVWQSVGEITVPEQQSGLFKAAASSGIAFSGGGSRAFVASLGILSGLHRLGLIDNVDYLTGISGVCLLHLLFLFNLLLFITILDCSLLRVGLVGHNSLLVFSMECI